MRLILLLT